MHRLLTLLQFRIAWSAGFTHGHGSYCLTADVAQDWVEHLTLKHEHMMHWAESDTESIDRTIDDLDRTIDADDLNKTIEVVEDVDILVPEFDDMPNLLTP